MQIFIMLMRIIIFAKTEESGDEMEDDAEGDEVSKSFFK